MAQPESITSATPSSAPEAAPEADRVGAHLTRDPGCTVGSKPQSTGDRAQAFWRTVGYGLWDNPVLVKEFRTRMRGTRAYWILLGYTLLLSGVLSLIYFNFEASNGGDLSNVSGRAAQDLGRWVYYIVFILQSVMVALITPAITSGTVTIEREQRSYELLVTTPLLPVDIIRGKLAAAVSFVVLLLTSSLPLVSISFLVGGVSPGEILWSFLLVALSAFLYGAIGIFWSATLRTTAIATVVTYLTVLSLFLVTMSPGLTAQAASSGGAGAAQWMPFQAINPIGATLRAVQFEYFFAGQVPAWVAGVVLNLLAAFLVSVCAMCRLEHFDPPRPIWVRGLATALWAAFGLFLFGPILGNMGRTVSNAQLVNENVANLMIAMITVIAVAVPILNTGDLIVRRGESATGRYLSGLLPHRLFRSDLPSGVPLALLWALLWLAIIPLSGSIATRAALFNPLTVYVPGAVVAICVVLGLAGIGHLLSVLLPSRWAACILTYLAGVVMMVLPYSTLMFFEGAGAAIRTPQPLYQLLYLSPWLGMTHLGSKTLWINQPALMFQNVVPTWVVTSVLYLALAAFGFGLALARVHQQGRHLQQRLEATEQRFRNSAAQSKQSA